MAKTTAPKLEDRSAGFLSEVTRVDSRIDGAVLLVANYNAAVFSDQLFDALDIPCPPNIARAAPKRKADFLAGRAIANAAMAELGFAPTPIGTAPSRAPIWPEGIAGSISHARGRCACLLARDTGHSLGVDTEAIASGGALRAIRAETLTAKDRDTIAKSAGASATNATRAFSAKEALFKALYPMFGRFFGFDAAELAAPLTETELTLILTEDLSPSLTKGRTFALQSAHLDTHVLTWLAVSNA